jgi:exodeoxyribonuclease VII small subunit
MSQQSNQFEQSLQKLESIVKNLESGTLSLEDALTAFQEGVGLVKQCQGMLSVAEQKVEMLVRASAEGGAETKPFNAE